ncbi:chromatin assembly factor 1 subunit A-domain-containing protein [Chlamydoabsidia padenii]|nr:chromatin assembly factor 1 subunit A-domain-containing protein [Chlamydoabsidia padenii]
MVPPEQKTTTIQQTHSLAFLDSGHLKDGRLFYREAKLRPETHIYAAKNIIAFRSYRQSVESTILQHQSQGISDIPEEYTPLITMLVQDSDESLPLLANRLNEILSPFNRNEQVSEAYCGILERKIRSVATRRKYGLDLSVGHSIEGTPSNVPSHLTISRWEANDVTQLPPDYQQLLFQRREERKLMSHQLTQLYRSLPNDLQQYILSTKHRKSNASYEEKIKSVEELAMETEQKRIKNEQKRKREEERLEEKRKREEEKLEEKRKRDEDRKKKEQSQLRLTSLFTTKNNETKGINQMDNEHGVESKSMFPPFFVKDHVNMFMESNEFKTTYLKELKEKQPSLTRPRGIKRKVDIKHLLLPGSDYIHRPENKSLLKMKLLQFTENVRPAYYGTWTKLSRNITPKNPFTMDIGLVDYDYDSEAEWEPEGEGEDIQSGDEDEDEVPSESIDPEDIGWLVPEGYLSEGEGVNDSDDDGMTKIVQRLSVRPKSRKNVPVRPIIVGSIKNENDDVDYNQPLNPFGIRMLIDVCDPNGYDPFATIVKKPNTLDNTFDHASKTPKFNEEHTAALINIVNNGKMDGLNKLVIEAKANPLLCDFSKTRLEAKIKDVAIKEKRGSDTKSAWYVKNEQDNPITPASSNP